MRSLDLSDIANPFPSEHLGWVCVSIANELAMIGCRLCSEAV